MVYDVIPVCMANCNPAEDVDTLSFSLRQPSWSSSSYSSLFCTFWKRVEGNLNKKLGMRSASSYLLADHSAWHIAHRQALETYPSYFRREDILWGIVNAILFMYMFCLLVLSIITTGMLNDKQRITLHWNCHCCHSNRHFKLHISFSLKFMGFFSFIG